MLRQMSDDLGSLALVLNDPLAPGVLVWWRANRATIEGYDIRDLARCLHSTLGQAKASVHRCDTAGLIHDGGISPTAAKWLGALVAKSMGVKPARRKKTDE